MWKKSKQVESSTPQHAGEYAATYDNKKKIQQTGGEEYAVAYTGACQGMRDEEIISECSMS